MKSILNNKGFTLIELMIVVAIMGILVTIAVPNYYKMIPHMRLKGAVMDVSQVFQLARMKAVAKNKTYMVKFNNAADSFVMGPMIAGVFTPEQNSSSLGWKGIDLKNLGFSAATETELRDSGVSGNVRFNSDGSASVDATTDLRGEAGVYLRNNPLNNNEEYRVMVSEMTGKIKVQHFTGVAGALWVE